MYNTCEMAGPADLSLYLEFCILVRVRVKYTVPDTYSSGLNHIVDLRPALMPHEHVPAGTTPKEFSL
jgi:hypothetical protein